MAIIKKQQNTPTTIKKKKLSSPKVQSVREPSSIREMGDVNFGSLDENKNGQLISYDVTTNKFVLVDPEVILNVSAEDNIIADNVITAIEDQINLADIVDYDGGVF